MRGMSAGVRDCWPSAREHAANAINVAAVTDFHAIKIVQGRCLGLGFHIGAGGFKTHGGAVFRGAVDRTHGRPSTN
jgi:hypothetical protein